MNVISAFIDKFIGGSADAARFRDLGDVLHVLYIHRCTQHLSYLCYQGIWSLTYYIHFFDSLSITVLSVYCKALPQGSVLVIEAYDPAQAL